MAEVYDVEKVIDFLKNEKGITLTEMIGKLGIERGGFLSWRRSTNKGRRDLLAQKLRESYAEHFTNGSPRPTADDIENKYMTMLEAEVARLKEENKRLLDWIENEIRAIAAGKGSN